MVEHWKQNPEIPVHSAAWFIGIPLLDYHDPHFLGSRIQETIANRGLAATAHNYSYVPIFGYHHDIIVSL